MAHSHSDNQAEYLGLKQPEADEKSYFPWLPHSHAELIFETALGRERALKCKFAMVAVKERGANILDSGYGLNCAGPCLARLACTLSGEQRNMTMSLLGSVSLGLQPTTRL